MSLWASVFTARYDGWCGRCMTPIRPGQDVAYADADDSLEHADCEERSAITETARPACPACFMVHALHQAACE